jgi:hypothetical protein
MQGFAALVGPYRAHSKHGRWNEAIHGAPIRNETAGRFYLSAGYDENGPTILMFGMPSYPLSKPLTVHNC